ncbi:hypothetical protein OHD16_06035 [Sphingobacterium sp. ML3W]|uniref:hypothetical protein n=1 Tax=Sphingobacterium sp. ML3W TaxID=1538644 RepID=UPI00249C58CD|nr:hypothetical protein [Sphingobacterium sp. ML3W]WFA79526.1 hypothetical protein OGI71_26275 [Sphingobacterium sp. ML3W]
MKKPTIKRLNRFTTLPILLDLLQRKKLTLLNPQLWEDKNDAEVILEYKKRKKVRNLFAICMSHADETIHNWKAFSQGSSGCVIEFNAIALFEILDNIPNLRHQAVVYRKLGDIEKKDSIIDIEEMPFTKRWPYRCEEEYRIIAVSNNMNDTFLEIDISLDIINKITISQQMPDTIYKTIKDHLKGLKGNPESRINRSTLYENKRWINRFKKI